MKHACTSSALVLLLSATLCAEGASPPQVVSEQKVGRNQGGMIGTTTPDPLDRFGTSIALLGDLDNDGVDDYAVGAPNHDDGFPPSGGGVWILFMRANGTVRVHQPITEVFGGLGNVLDQFDAFGDALAPLGDLDGDGVEDLAVGAPRDDDGGSSTGSVWILFLNTNGTVKDKQKISTWAGGFAGSLAVGDFFGSSLANLGDLDGDSVVDLAVGAPGTGSFETGAVWILHLLPDGTVKFEERIDEGTIGFAGVIDSGDRFGEGVAGLDDLDGDGVPDLAVGASGDELSGSGSGAVYVLFLNTDASVKGSTAITFGSGGFVDDGFGLGLFGQSVANLGDMNGDGVVDLAAGDPLNVEGAGAFLTKGAVWILLLDVDGTVQGQQKIGAVQGNLGIALPDNSDFGAAVSRADDHDGDGNRDLIVGAPMDPDGGTQAGAVYTLFLGIAASVESRNFGTNPGSLTADLPVLGAAWTPTVDLTTTGHSFAQILAYKSPLQVTIAGGQTLLMNIADPDGEQLGQPLLPGPSAQFPIAIPNDPALSGLCLTVQAIHALGVTPFALSNAIDVVVGL